MTREEARTLVYGNPEAAVELIFQLSEAVEILQARVAELEPELPEKQKPYVRLIS